MLRIGVVGGLSALLIGLTRDRGMFAWVVGVLPVFYGGVLAYYWYRRSPSTRPTGSSWAAMGSLRFDEAKAAGVASGLTVKSERRLRFWTRGLEAIGGRLEVLSDLKTGRTLDMQFLGSLEQLVEALASSPLDRRD